MANEDIKNLIISGEINKIKRVANLQGMKTMLDDGIKKVLQGETTVQEIWRALNGIYDYA